MIELDSRNRASAGDASRRIPILGIGGAGANALDRLALDGAAPAGLIAANSDAQALTASVAGEKIQLGASATRGLGCGGDPELGRCAAEESAGEIRAAVESAEAVILVAGLGGGTGSGAIPLAAEIAHDSGALVIAVVTLPFGFEGRRRASQAAEALADLQRRADAVICFENDRMGEIVPAASGIQTAFAAADQTLSQCIQAIAGMLQGSRGLISLGLDDLAAVLQDVNARCLFGFGQGEGKNRSFDALSRALKNPLMDKGRLLRDCETVLVRVSGGPDLTLDEVQLLMEEFNRYVNDHTRILFGAAVEPALAGRVSVGILSSIGGIQSLPARPVQTVRAERPAAQKTAPAPAAPELIPGEEPEAEPEPEPEPVEQATEPEADEPIDAADAADADAFELEPTSPDEAGLPVVTPGEEEGLAPEPEPEPAPEPPRHQKPRGVRTSNFQASLFGEEPVAPVERIPPPVPGRMLRHPFPQPAPEPPVEEAAPSPATVYRQAAARVHVPEPQAAAEPEPVPDMEAVPEPEPIEPQPMAREPDAAPVAPAPEPPPVPTPHQRSIVRRIIRRTASAAPEPPPELIPPDAPQAGAPGKTPQQEVMQFEPVTRGRFEKSEPTIVDGQDLDVPTYLRRRLKLR